MSMKENDKNLKIYFTSDVHGYFYPTSYGDHLVKSMGLFQCAPHFEKDENTLVIDGGDILQGSAFAAYSKQVRQSAVEIAQIMNDCGYDYYTLGNHDFNYGLEHQKSYREAHHGICVCQNVTDEQGNVLYPYVIHTMKNGLKLALIGIVTDYINVWEKEENLVGIRVTDPFEAAKKALDEVRGKVDLTIGIYHGGFECDVTTGEILSDTKENIGGKICKELDFNILLTGHQHMSIDGQYLYGTYIVQPTANAREYHCIKVKVDENGKKEITSERLMADINVGQKLCKAYETTENAIQEWLDQPLGHLSRELRPTDKIDMALHGSPIADFLNTVQLYFSKAQISVVGLANEIAGFRTNVSVRDILATYPFPNTLIVCKITGKQLKTVMERSAEYFAEDENGNICVAESFLKPKVEHYNYDYFAGVDYEINPHAPVGERIVHLQFQGKEVQAEDEFSLCLNNYRYSGAGGYPTYTKCETIREINIEMSELIAEYFRQNPYVEI